MFGCVQYTRVGDEQLKETKQTTITVKNSEKKYYQLNHGFNNSTIVQIITPNEKACNFMKANTLEDMKPFCVCTEVSASNTLPYRATIRNKTHGFVVDLEAKNLLECTAIVDGVLNTKEGKASLELVSECKKK
jgi:alpha-L-fucosidase